MNQDLSPFVHASKARAQALRLADLVRGADVGIERVLPDRPVRRYRLWLPLCFVVLACLVFIGRGSASATTDDSQVPSGCEHSGQVTLFRLVHNPPLGPVRPGSKNILRSGRCHHGYLLTFGFDDPNDDETSDDPTDDDDGWEGLNALGETPVPVSALFQEIRCIDCDLETCSEFLGNESFPFTSFLKLQRLRC